MKFFISSFLFMLLTISQIHAQDTISVKVINNLAYYESNSLKPDSLQMLNLALPENVDNAPLLIWIGGGAWSYVNRHMEMNLANKFARQGIAVASVGHRLSAALWRDSTFTGTAEYPDHIHDLSAAVNWLYQHAPDYGYSRGKFFIGGFSSGAHLATMLCLDSSFLNKYELSPQLFKGLVSMSGAYDIEHYHEVFLNGRRPELAKLHVESVFGNTTEKLKSASPVQYMTNLSTPILLFSDNSTYKYANIFEEAIRETEFQQLQSMHLHDTSHGDLWRSLSFDEESIYREVIINFILSLS